jgi:UDP-N-acetylmuramoyl-L-alanyl-D-glutamate--2,6-diaminopimelate ligase
VVSLVDIAAVTRGRVTGADVRVTGITANSALVRPGDLFAAIPGRQVHGARFAAAALSSGALAVLTDEAGLALVSAQTPAVEVGDVRAVLGAAASEVYGRPSEAMAVFGVTGTSGKTTTTFFLRAGLRAAGIPSGLIGTVATLIAEEEVATGFTTPEAPEVQALLAVMREHGAEAVAMEVSSHALSLGRADGMAFRAAGFTNLSQDHLDFHADMEDYFAAKARLFDGRSQAEVVVVDDEWGRRLVRRDTVTVSGRAAADATWRAVQVVADQHGCTTFRAIGPGLDVPAGCCVPGRYNVANALLAIAMLHAAGVDPEVAAPAIQHATVPGRMERIDAGQPFLAIVDYSHKPAAVEAALRALRPLTAGRLILVLGSGGDRDRAKRRLMGEVAARGADLLLVTDDNPRSEDPAAIRAAMIAGARSAAAGQRAEIREIGDRQQAISEAVATARPGDTVLVAGKGHETGQEVAGTVYPFDDRSVLRAALAALR